MGNLKPFAIILPNLENLFPYSTLQRRLSFRKRVGLRLLSLKSYLTLVACV
jgi:hypothetical protein